MSISYKPLPDNCTISQSDIHGFGLFATMYIPAAYSLGITHVKDSDFEDGYIRTPLGGFINHSDQPNCRLVPRAIDNGHVLYLETLRTIESGEELTTKYSIGRY